MSNTENYINTYKKHLAQGWYEHAFSSDRLELWNDKFVPLPGDDPNAEPKICAHYLLHSLIYYQDKQLESIILGIANQIISKINQKEELRLGRRLSESELTNAWNLYKKDTCIIAASDPADASDSAYHVIRLWRNILGLKTKSLLNLDTIVQKYKHIIFVDDMVGTGKKISGFLNNQTVTIDADGAEMNLHDYIKKNQGKTDFNLAVFAMYCEGLEVLNNEFSDINCYYGDYYNETYNLLSKDCVFFDLFSGKEEYIIKYLYNQMYKLDFNEEYNRNLSISFQYGCPNNTLPLYYIGNSDWINLLKESHPNRKKGNNINEDAI